ncbi:MAG TPA: GntR family transcriptional regulator [Chthoniobacteraceae bacterium]|nr:GntR family transcriptional regulator [Chthoniobacteraceae bacterium]
MARLYETIADQLTLQRRTLSAPLALPGEFELAREFGASRETIRRALKQLEAEGAVMRRHGVGSFLQPETPSLGGLRGKTVGVVPPWWAEEPGAWYTSMIYEGIQKWADANDCQFTILHCGPRSARLHQWLESTRKIGVAGLIWVQPQESQFELLHMAARHFPTVALGRAVTGDGLRHVVPDYENAGALIDACLVEHRRSTYAVIGKNVYDPVTQTWIESISQAHRKRDADFNPAQHHFDYQCFHLTQLADLLLDFYLPVHPEVQALVFPTSGCLHSLLANTRFREAASTDLAIITTNYGPYPVNSLFPGHKLTHVACNWSNLANKAMIQLDQLVAGHPIVEGIKEPVTLVPGDTVSHLA